MYHHESASRGSDSTDGKTVRFAADVQFMLDRWGEVLLDDPAYNPDLSLQPCTSNWRFRHAHTSDNWRFTTATTREYMRKPRGITAFAGWVDCIRHDPAWQWQRVALKALVLLLVAFMSVRLAPVDGPHITMRIHASHAGVAQWFLDSGHGYTEQESLKAPLKKGRNLVQFTLPAGTYDRLRFDPIKGDSPVTIESVSITPADQVVAGAFGIDDFSAAVAISRLEHVNTGVRVVPDQGSHDPQLSVDMTRSLVVRGPARSLVEQVMAALAMAALGWLLLEVVLTRMSVAQVVRLGVGAAFVLIIAMNVVSLTGGSLHPDERLHVACFDYFLHHFWPPAADDPAIVNSLQSSPWGVSYLNNYDVVYFIAGHVMAPFAGIFDSPKAMARAFQNVLWLALLGFTLRRKKWALASAVLLVSPQVWYIFSYFNGDAFTYFLCSVAVMLVCDANGGLARYLRGGGKLTVAAVVFSLCLGLALVSKANYAPVIMGLFLWIAVRHMQARWLELVAAMLMVGLAIAAEAIATWAGPELTDDVRVLALVAGLSGLVALASLAWRYARQRDIRPVMHRGLVLLALVLLFAAPRVANDLYINGGPAAKADTVSDMREKYARQDFKPSVIEAGNGYHGLHLSREGVSLSDMLVGRWHWLNTSAKSAFGTYGYMNVWASPRIYRWQWLALLILTAAAAVALMRRKGGRGAKQVFVVLGTALLILLSSVLFSWLYDFQPQGRYLLPMLPMAALMLASAIPLLPPRFVKLMLVISLVLSAWSFLAAGIPGIAAQAG